MINIYIENIAEGVTEDDILKTFSQYGKIASVNFIKDGNARRFAFVAMPIRDEAYSAIKNLNGKQLKGSSLKVKEADTQV